MQDSDEIEIILGPEACERPPAISSAGLKNA